MTTFTRLTLASLMFIATATFVFADSAQTITSVKADKPPTIDGDINEKFWEAIKPVSVKDQASNTTILLRSAYTNDKVYFSVWFQDSAETPLHKPDRGTSRRYFCLQMEHDGQKG
jgi:hypothetical protein